MGRPLASIFAGILIPGGSSGGGTPITDPMTSPTVTVSQPDPDPGGTPITSDTGEEAS